jgi:NADPH:quinone reductase-like Zn-dependent oxidoreductase
VPEPKENQVLIEVHAASINYSTIFLLKGKPLFMRLFPLPLIPGGDVAGKIVKV